jgi:hypothetical protein
MSSQYGQCEKNVENIMGRNHLLNPGMDVKAG